MGSGFDAAAQIGCPVLVDTTWISAGELTGSIPDDMVGAEGTGLAVGVYVRNPDGTASRAMAFTVQFPATEMQAWTSVGKVAAAVPGFKRGGQVKDDDILGWIREAAQEIAGALMRRGLPLDPAQWAAANTAAFPTPQGLLEMINRAGASAMLAAAIASNFSASGPWAVQVQLQKQYDRQLTALKAGDYDKLFRPGAATVESAPLLSAGDMTNDDGSSSAAFTKGKVF